MAHILPKKSSPLNALGVVPFRPEREEPAPTGPLPQKARHSAIRDREHHSPGEPATVTEETE